MSELGSTEANEFGASGAETCNRSSFLHSFTNVLGAEMSISGTDVSAFSFDSFGLLRLIDMVNKSDENSTQLTAESMGDQAERLGLKPYVTGSVASASPPPWRARPAGRCRHPPPAQRQTACEGNRISKSQRWSEVSTTSFHRWSAFHSHSRRAINSSSREDQ